MCHLGRLKHVVKVARWSFKKVVFFSGRRRGREWDQERTHVEASTAFGMFYFFNLDNWFTSVCFYGTLCFSHV